MAILMVQPIPERFRAACSFCQKELDIRAERVHQWTSGWVMNRSGGGGHGISLPERASRWACERCIEARAKGSAGQRWMFDR